MRQAAAVSGRSRCTATPLAGVPAADRPVRAAGHRRRAADDGHRPRRGSVGQPWNPVTGHTAATSTDPAAAAANTVAWYGPGCAQTGCPLRLTDPSSGHTQTVPLPTGAAIDSA